MAIRRKVMPVASLTHASCFRYRLRRLIYRLKAGILEAGHAGNKAYPLLFRRRVTVFGVMSYWLLGLGYASANTLP